MKRFLFVIALTVVALVATEKKASAWCNFNFGAGLNTGFQCGGSKIGKRGFMATQNAQSPFGNQFGNQSFEQGECVPAMPLAEPKKEDPKSTPKSALDNASPMPLPTSQSMQQINYNYYPQYQSYPQYQGYSQYQGYQGYDNYAAPGYWYDR